MASEKVVLVTGCSSGLGRALCEALGACKTLEGLNVFRVFATARKLESISDLEGKGTRTMTMDVQDASSVKDCVAAVLKEAGKIDVCIANAGLFRAMPVVEHPIEDAEAILDTNVLGVMRFIQAVAPGMVERKRGTIVCVGSIADCMVSPFAGVYSSSKACLMSLMDCLRMELSPWNINVVLVEAGPFKSAIAENAKGRSVLDSESMYKRFKASVEKQLYFAQSQPRLKSAESVADIIVKKIQKGNPPCKIVVGNNAFLYKILGFLSIYICPRIVHPQVMKAFGM